MPAVSLSLLPALLLGLRQLLDPAVLRILAKSFAVTLVLFALVAAGGWWALDTLLARGGLADGLFAGAGAVRGATSAVLALLGLWLMWRVVAMAVIQFYADDIVQAVERRHYPAMASTARDPSLAEQAGQALRSGGRALLFNLLAAPVAVALLVTGFGPALVFWLVNALLLGRELQDMVWLRHAPVRDAVCPIGKGERFLLGGAIAALLAVPFANFLAPVLGAASAAHLVHRRLPRAAHA